MALPRNIVKKTFIEDDSQKLKMDQSIHKVIIARKSAEKINASPSHKSKKDYCWFLKKTGDNLQACCEVIGQELFRLLAPELTDQPKTRIADFLSKKAPSSPTSKSLFVASKQAPNFTSIAESKEYAAKTATISVPNLGFTTAISLFLNETDLKLAHIDVNQGTKIDGDWLLSCLTMDGSNKEKLTVTSADLDKLPYVSNNYKATNWLDQIVGGKLNHKASKSLSVDPQQVHEAILRIILLPEWILDKFVKSYLPEELGLNKPVFENEIFKEIIRLQCNYKKAAQENNSFMLYIASDKANKHVANFATILWEFVTTGKNQLVDNHLYELIDELQKTKAEMGRISSASTPSPRSVNSKNRR